MIYGIDRRVVASGFAALLLAAAPAAFAQGSGAGSLSSADRSFLQTAAQGGAFELQISQMAASKAQDPKIRQYAEMVVNDHAHSTQELKQVGQKYNVDLSMTPDQSDETRISSLQSLGGANFDVAYLQDMKQANEQDLSSEKQEANSTSNSQMKQFAQQEQNTDEKHAQDADKLKSEG